MTRSTIGKVFYIFSLTGFLLLLTCNIDSANGMSTSQPPSSADTSSATPAATTRENAPSMTTYERLFGPPPGKFVSTTEHGPTHYLLQGPVDGDLVILQHGLGSNCQVFNDMAAALVQQGKRVLRYDFYDRGYSETDPTRYPVVKVGTHPLAFTLDLHVKQMRQVLQALELDQTDFVHVGHSTGGVVGMAYAAEYPQHIKGLVLVDSVCLPPTKPLAARLADLPVVGDLLVRFMGVNTLIKFARNSCHDPSKVEPLLQALERNARENPRYFAAIRSTNANCLGFVGSAEPLFRECCRSAFPLHFIWGKADQSVPYDDCRKLQAIAREEMGKSNVTELAFDDMPHNVFFPDAKPKECMESIHDFCIKAFGS